MLLLAEAHTVNREAAEALKVYQEVLDARTGAFGAEESNKDLYRKMAPLLQQLGNFVEAANCLQKVVDEETSEILKVGLLTKIAGNFKKADKEKECIEASKLAFELMQALAGDKDPQTCRCQLNLAQVYQHFEKVEEAKGLYE